MDRRTLAHLIFGAIILLSSAARAESYRPFEFTSEAQSEAFESRSDIRPVRERIRFRSETIDHKRLTALPYSDLRGIFFTEIAELLERARVSANDTRIRLDRLPRDASVCSLYMAFAEESFLPARSTCPLLATARAQLYEGVGDCLDVNFPERFVEEHPSGIADRRTLSSIEGQIKTAGEALFHTELPAFLIPENHALRLRQIILKLRIDAFRERYKKRIREQEDSLRVIQTSKRCLAASEDEINRVEKFAEEILEDSKRTAEMLEQIDQEGRAHAEMDRQKVLRSGRKRDVLPYPNLTDSERELLAMYLGGVYWRMRGGGLLDDPQGTRETRILFTLLPMRSLGEMAGGTIGAQAGDEIYAALGRGWGGWTDMGRTRKAGEGDRYYDLAHLSNRGRYQVLGAAKLLRKHGYDSTDLLVAGLQMGIIYDYAHEHLSDVKIGADLKKPYAPFLEGPTAWGEFGFGAAISLGLVRSLLKGYDPRTIRFGFPY